MEENFISLESSGLNDFDHFKNIVTITEDGGDKSVSYEYKPKLQKSNFIIEDYYGSIKDQNGKNVVIKKYVLVNEHGVNIEIINYGATILSCWVPNTLGEIDDVILGFDTLDDYRLNNAHYIGGTIGRVTDYITNGNFVSPGGHIIELTKNIGSHHYNGGKNGFDKVIWDGYVSENKLVMTYTSLDSEEGYPGSCQTRVIFQLTCKNELIIDYVSMTSKPTPLNISMNIFFNLAGHDAGESEVLNHSIMVNADEYIVIKLPDRTPVGLFGNVERTCLDLRVPRLLKRAFVHVPGSGYNHTFKLFKGNDRKAFNLAASLVHKPSGRTLDVYTDMPCIHVNTAQGFPDYGILDRINKNSAKVTDLVPPSAIFGESGSEHHSEGVEDTTINSLEQLVSEDMEEGTTIKIPETNLYLNNKATINSPIIGKSKTIYNKLSGISLRPQLFPDAPNHDNFGNIITQPSNFYSQRVIYKFGVIETN
ncbi:galactose mutarotase-like [Daktulosphaira vitifoliae]|uniref:galactose mutarotase-like n=1 Tax=Daktulosphaira vitifoliae TaxID=58002 RepID=UPI0021AAEFAF|nr:galactose mutarotase-like [Daktulosphaira vitifoliae]